MRAVSTSETSRSLKLLGAKEILYFSRKQKPDIEKEIAAKFVDLDTLLAQSDIVSLHASKEAGKGYITKEKLAKMKDSALLINCTFPDAVDIDALFDELKAGRLRAAQDDTAEERFSTLPLSVWFNSNISTAYNTHEANKIASDMATQSMINLLKTGNDQYKVN